MLPWPGWVGRGADERNHRCIGRDVPLPGTDSAPRPVTPPIAARRVWLRGRGPWVTLRWPRRADLTPAGPAEGCRSGRTGRSRKPLYLMGTVGSNPTPSATKSLNPWNLLSGFELTVRLAADCGAFGLAPANVTGREPVGGLILRQAPVFSVGYFRGTLRDMNCRVRNYRWRRCCCRLKPNTRRWSSQASGRSEQRTRRSAFNSGGWRPFSMASVMSGARKARRTTRVT